MLTPTPTQTCGRTTRPGSDTQKLVADTHRLLGNCGIALSPSKVSKLVRRYIFQVERNGYSFADYLANTVRLTAEQRRAVLADPGLARVISYADPTGETAVNNVIRRAGG